MTIKLSHYQPEWPELFEKEKSFLINKVGKYLEGSIEHVGSTSVKNMIAKPIIDIMFGVKSLEHSKGAIGILKDNGYCHYPYKEDVMHWFCKPSPEIRTHHLHLVPYESSLWRERINFRDLLRSNIDIAKEYSDLKANLAKEYGSDREEYTKQKWPFIQKVLNNDRC